MRNAASRGITLPVPDVVAAAFYRICAVNEEMSDFTRISGISEKEVTVGDNAAAYARGNGDIYDVFAVAVISGAFSVFCAAGNVGTAGTVNTDFPENPAVTVVHDENGLMKFVFKRRFYGDDRKQKIRGVNQLPFFGVVGTRDG